MKIFFYANTNMYEKSNGISKKVSDQIDALRRMGNKVYYTTYIDNGIEILDDKDQVIFHYEFPFTKKIFRYLRRGILIDKTYHFIEKNDRFFDFCYLRFHYFDFKYMKMLKQMQSSGKVVVEAHGYPYRHWTPLLYYVNIRDIIFTPLCRKYINLVAAISNCHDIWGCKTIFIDNCVNIDKYTLRKDKKKDYNCLNLISVAVEQYYHGFNKIIKGLFKYYREGGQQEIKIYMIGVYLEETKRLVKELGLEENIIFMGKMYGEELNLFYDNMDLALGSFSVRADSEYGSSIKTKEYFAKGIPFINGWKEYAFDDSYPYVKRFDLNDEYIDFNQVIDFYNKIKEDKNLKNNMRKFAEENFTWDKQFQNIFKELKEN